MEKHRWFNLRLHTDDELSALLNTTISQRETLHEWPLSCVQRLVTAQDNTWIYKTQIGPTVESLFYAQAQSDLLVAGRTIYQQEGYVVMLYECIDAPLIQNLNLSAHTVTQIGREVQRQIQAIKGNIPVLADVSGPVRWRRLVTTTADDLRTLVNHQQFTRVTREAIDHVQHLALSGAVLTATRRNCGVVHGDLTGANLFILPDGRYKLIDWTRPFRGPTDIDLAALLASLGHDPLAAVDRSILTMLYILRIEWLTQCARRWFPAGIATYDDQIAALLDQVVHLK